tara:strand:+ start:305 stop:913 length:609 start_codon:yes stop_codon:yes gene_type:complete
LLGLTAVAAIGESAGAAYRLEWTGRVTGVSLTGFAPEVAASGATVRLTYEYDPSASLAAFSPSFMLDLGSYSFTGVGTSQLYDLDRYGADNDFYQQNFDIDPGDAPDPLLGGDFYLDILRAFPDASQGTGASIADLLDYISGSAARSSLTLRGGGQRYIAEIRWRDLTATPLGGVSVPLPAPAAVGGAGLVCIAAVRRRRPT